MKSHFFCTNYLCKVSSKECVYCCGMKIMMIQNVMALMKHVLVLMTKGMMNFISSIELKYAIFNKTKIFFEEQDRCIGLINYLLLGVAQRKSIRALKGKAKLLLDLVEEAKPSLPDDDLSCWKNLGNS